MDARANRRCRGPPVFPDFADALSTTTYRPDHHNVGNAGNIAPGNMANDLRKCGRQTNTL